MNSTDSTNPSEIRVSGNALDTLRALRQRIDELLFRAQPQPQHAELRPFARRLMYHSTTPIEANRRAEILAQAILPLETYTLLSRYERVLLPSVIVPGRQYEIQYGRSIVNVLENGNYKAALCGQPGPSDDSGYSGIWPDVARLPEWDVALFQWLQITGNELVWLEACRVLGCTSNGETQFSMAFAATVWRRFPQGERAARRRWDDAQHARTC